VFADYVDFRDFRGRMSSFVKIDAVFHQGACSDTMQGDGRYMLDNNYEFSKELLELALSRRVPFLYASSASVYGDGRAGFREEPACEKPLNVYGYSKLLFDQAVRRVLEARSAQIAGLRYFNVYGPNEAHKGRMASVAFHAYNQFKAEGRVKLFVGSDGYRDGEQRRDFIHVDDVVAVNLWLLERRDVSGIFNCGTGKAQSFNRVAAAVINTARGTASALHDLVAERLIEYIPFPPQLVGKYQSFTEADMSRLRAAGYPGEFLGVDEGVAAYVEALGT